MAGLQRFITYIYKYKDDEKMENAGFAKIEIRGGQCRMEVHIRNVSTQQPEATIYLFARNEKVMQGIPVGSIPVSRGNGDVRYSFEIKELSNFGLTMDDMEGIVILLEENDYLASQWREGTIAKNLFHILNKKETSEDTPVQNAPVQNALERKQNEPEENKQTKEDEKPFESEDDVREEAQSEAQQEKAQPIRATGLPEEAHLEEAGWERVFQKLRLKLDIFYPFEGQEIECVRMQLNDLHEFPKKYWYIGNNSFLLHGFFNYRHVIFGELKEETMTRHFIGVPGIFQNQERIMAALFGFPEFRTAKTAEYKTGSFGYWYRFI